MSQKLTDWFPADVKPVRVGVYQTRQGEEFSDWFQFWNGTFWSESSGYVDGAFRSQGRPSEGFNEVEWRGLAQPPKGKK
jgi:hypothetical protein